MKFKFNFSNVGFLIALIIVAAGWVYGFTSDKSYIVIQMKATPAYMKLLSLIPFSAVGFLAYKGGKNPNLIGYAALPYILGIFVAAIFGILFLIGFGQSFR